MPRPDTKSKKNYYIMRKEWWSDELAIAAKKTHLAEKDYVKIVKARRDAALAKARFSRSSEEF